MELSTREIQNSVGARIKEMRVRSGLSQRDLAGGKYDGSYVSQIESGRRVPSAEAFAYFASKLKVPVEELSARIPPSLRLEMELALKGGRDAFDRGDLEAARELYGGVLEDATSVGEIELQAEGLMGLGIVDEASGEMLRALERYRLAEELEPSEETLIRVRLSLGRAYRTAGDLAYSVDLMERVLDEAKRRGWALHAVRAATHLAGTLLERGDHRRAREVLDSVVEESELLRDPMALAALHWARAQNAAGLGGAVDALNHIARARGLYEQQDAALELARLEGSHAYYLIEMGRSDEAAPILEESVAALTRAGATLEAARLQTEQARAELGRGRIETAREIAERTLEVLRGLQDPLEEALCALILGIALGTEKRAEVLLTSAAERFEERGAREEHAKALQALADFYSATGRTEEALATYRRALSKAITPVVP